MYIKKYWGNFIGGSDDSLNLVAFLEDLKKEEIPLSEIFIKIGLDKQNWDFRQTVEYLEFTHSNGVEMDFHFAIDVVTDLAAILLECSISGSVNLQDLDEYNTPARRIRITATPEEHDAMNKALADFAQNPQEYDLSEMMDDEEIQEMARDVEALRKELYESAGRNRDYHAKAEDMKNLLPDWEEASGCIATNRITVEGCKVGYCYREKPDGDWDSGWRFTAGDESDEYMDDPNNAGIYGLNTICNDDPDIILLLNTPAPCAFERDEHGVFQQIKDWKPDEDEEDPDMDILQQCQKWNENSEYQKIIDALEAIPAQERTPEMDSELARAYNNLGAPSNRALLKKAIALLKPHEEYFEGDHCWNFRMGYSYFYLDQEGRALRYFEKALEARPGDEDTMELIDWCKKGISLPQFSQCFRERTENWWETFAEMEGSLRQMMDDDKDHTRGAEIVAQMEGALNQVFDEISFEMGFNGEKYELILTPEGDKVKLFELVYFQKHASKEVLEHWNILVGRQPIRNIGLRTDDGWDISGDDVQIWLEEQGENSFAISAYCEKLLPMLREAEGRVWWMLTTLTDQVLGEIPHMRYIDSFDVLEEPKAEQSFLLSQLPDKLKENGANLSTDPEAYLESYLGYEMKPNEDPDADWRLDVMVGSTCCAPLINGYLNADNDFMDALHADGAVAGFFCYPLDTLREEEGSEKIFDFRDKLEEVFTTGDGPEILTLTGGATGLFCGYRKLLRDCRRGKIDLILVKSLSRFGRDARESISTIRKLKQMNVGIYIELGGIFTMKTPDSVIDLYAAFAQAESQTRSESIKFGIQNRMRSGRTILNHRQFLGYTKGPDGVLQIVPEEAEIVQKIFDLYIQGNGVRKIKKYLESHGIKTVTGKTEWSTSTIDRMLSNEKYVGQVLMQKTYTPDFLTGKQVKNTGQKEMYLVENAHEPIIDQETFDKVQKMKGQIKRAADMQMQL